MVSPSVGSPLPDNDGDGSEGEESKTSHDDDDEEHVTNLRKRRDKRKRKSRKKRKMMMDEDDIRGGGGAGGESSGDNDEGNDEENVPTTVTNVSTQSTTKTKNTIYIAKNEFDIDSKITIEYIKRILGDRADQMTSVEINGVVTVTEKLKRKVASFMKG